MIQIQQFNHKIGKKNCKVRKSHDTKNENSGKTKEIIL